MLEHRFNSSRSLETCTKYKKEEKREDTKGERGKNDYRKVAVSVHGSFAQRYRPAMPGGGATGAPAAGVPLTGIRSGAWCVPGTGVN
jgi:hypothetical protein